MLYLYLQQLKYKRCHTVLSRCQRFDFNRIDRELIQKQIKDICKKEDIKYQDDAVTEISYLSDGCMRDALSILDQLSKVSDEINMDVLKQNYGTVTDEDLNDIYKDILNNDLDSLINHINTIKESGVDIKIFINKMIENYINKAVEMKRKNMSSVAFNHIKEIIKILNELLISLNNTTNGYLMLQLNLLSFINSDDNKMSNREINQIVSNSIIPESILEEDNKSFYNICEKFIDIRVNNAFTGASKDLKNKIIDDFKQFKDYVKEKDIKEIYTIVNNCEPVLVSPTNIVFVTKRENNKILGNSKLDIMENNYNRVNASKYKMIFISEKEWKEYVSSFDKNKKYELINDDEYINNTGSQGLAKELFGDNINIE